jgi:chromosome segregation ATPase
VKHKLSIFLGLLIMALLFLLLRENEAKVAAQNQLNNIQYKATTMINEKGNAINELETQQTELQVKLQNTEEAYQKELAAGVEEYNKLTADTAAKAAQYEEVILQKNKDLEETEAEAKENSERFDKELKKKNAQISEIGEELRKTTERLAGSLKRVEEAESEIFSYRQNNAILEKQVQTLHDEQTRLEGLVAVSQGKPAVLD